MTREQEILLKMAKKALSADTSSDLISRADAINFVTKLIWNDGEIWNDVQDKIVDGINALPSAEAVQGWIPCSERLPSDSGNYLITVADFRLGHIGGHTVTIADFYAKEKKWNSVVDVTAWMPLPKPYREDGES